MRDRTAPTARTGPTSHPTRGRAWHPFVVGVPFTLVVTGVFSLSDRMPIALSLPLAAVWAVVVGLVGTWVGRRPVLGAWAEDVLVLLTAATVASAGFGGLVWLLSETAALQSPTLTGQTLVQMFLPSIPFYVASNGALEFLLVPLLLYVGWRPGPRRVLVVATVVLYFALRVWTYVAFVPNRLAFGRLHGSTEPFTAAGRHQAYLDLQLNDPRGFYLVGVLVILLVASQLPRRYELAGARS